MTRLPVVVVCCVAALMWADVSSASTVRDARRETWRLWGQDAPRMWCIFGKESSLNPRAVSRTNDHGIAQLNAPSWARYFGRRWALVYDPVANVRMAHRVWQLQGFGAWSTAGYC